jgi:hypothetical protein
MTKFIEVTDSKSKRKVTLNTEYIICYAGSESRNRITYLQAGVHIDTIETPEEISELIIKSVVH